MPSTAEYDRCHVRGGEENGNFHFLQDFVSFNTSVSLSLISPSLMVRLNIRLPRLRFIFAPLVCDLSRPSRRRGDNESGSQPIDGPDIPAAPFTQPAEKKRQYGGLMFYGLSALGKLRWEKSNSRLSCCLNSL